MKPTTETTDRIVDPFLRNQIEAQLLKYAAGQNITCPACGSIMDWKRTAIVTLYTSVSAKPDQLHQQYVQCTKCWSQRRRAFNEGLAKAQQQAQKFGVALRAEILDGRERRFKNIK